jgi:hypothetical protein
MLYCAKKNGRNNRTSLFNLSELDLILFRGRNDRSAKRIRKRKVKNRWRNRGYAIAEMDFLDEKDFTRMFRMDRDDFGELMLLVKDKIDVLPRGRINAINSSGSFIEPRTKLAVALRWLAGGSVHDIAFAFGVSKKSFYTPNGVLWKTIEAINSSFTISMHLSNEDTLANLEKGFADYSFNRLRGCVLAIDGWVVKCRAPYKSEVDNVSCSE